MSVVRRFFMVSRIMMLCGFAVMPGGVRVMFQSVSVMFGSFLGHGNSPCAGQTGKVL
jgi:hypothetical protein